MGGGGEGGDYIFNVSVSHINSVEHIIKLPTYCAKQRKPLWIPPHLTDMLYPINFPRRHQYPGFH